MENKYLNFPVPLLKDVFNDPRNTMNNIMTYAGYAHSLKMQGTEKERIKAAGRFFGITWGNPVACFKHGKVLYDTIPKNSPMTGINKDVLFDYYMNFKTAEEIAVLAAFLAIKSIVGPKPYCKVTNKYLIARMGGYARITDMPDHLPKHLVKYSTRRKLDNIKYELQAKWNVNFYSRYIRGFYVSIDQNLPLEDLVFQAEKRRKSNIQKQRNQAIEAARSIALQKLGIQN